MLSYRISAHSSLSSSSITLSPYNLLFARAPNMCDENFINTKFNPYLIGDDDALEYVTHLSRGFSILYSIAMNNMHNTHERTREWYNSKNHPKPNPIQLNDHVMVYTPSISKIVGDTRMKGLWAGPFICTKVGLAHVFVRPVNKPNAVSKVQHVSNVKKVKYTNMISDTNNLDMPTTSATMLE